MLAANFDLRGVARHINVTGIAAATGVEAYRIMAVCSTAEEVHVRSLVLHMLNSHPPEGSGV